MEFLCWKILNQIWAMSWCGALSWMIIRSFLQSFSILYFFLFFSQTNNWCQCIFVSLLVTYESRGFLLTSFCIFNHLFVLFRCSCLRSSWIRYPIHWFMSFKTVSFKSLWTDTLLQFFIGCSRIREADHSFHLFIHSFTWENLGFHKKSRGWLYGKSRRLLAKTFKFNAVLFFSQNEDIVVQSSSRKKDRNEKFSLKCYIQTYWENFFSKFGKMIGDKTYI